MERTLQIKIRMDKGDIAVTVKNGTVDAADDAKEKHTSESTDRFGSDIATTQAVTKAVTEFFTLLRADSQRQVDESPIGRAARG